MLGQGLRGGLQAWLQFLVVWPTDFVFLLFRMRL